MHSPRVILKFILVSLLFLFWCSSLHAYDYSLFNRPLLFYGYIKQEAGIGVRKGSDYYGKNMTNYSTFQIEWQYQIVPGKFHIHSINRLFGDMAYTIHDDKSWFKNANRTPSRQSVARRNMQWEWNRYDRGWEIVRELYADIFTEKFHFRLGRQQVVWGESDGLRLMDCINPQDLRREFNLRDSDEGYRDSRIPLWLLVGTYYPNIEPFGIRDLRFEFVINPGKPKTNRLEAYRSEGGVWAAKEPNLPWGVRVGLNDERPKTRLKNMEFAMRILGEYKGWMFTINAFYGRQHDFYLRPTAPDILVPAWDRRFLQLNFDKVYGWRRLVGFTLNKEVSAISIPSTAAPVLRVEALYEFKKPFQYEGAHAGDMAWTGLNADYSSYKKLKDQLRMMVGFDWNVYIRFLNPRESFFFSSQFFLFYITGGKGGELVNAPFYFTKKVNNDMLPPLPPSRDRSYIKPWRIHRTQKYFSFLVTTNYDNKRIIPQVLYLYDFEEHASGLKAKLNLAYGSHWRPEVGYMAWWGNDNTGKSFGLFEKNQQIYVKLKYQF